MKTFYVAHQPAKQERVDYFVSWMVVPMFALGFFAAEIWPAHKLSLQVGFYAIGSLLAVRFLVILARIPRQPINYRSLRLSDSGLEYRGLSPELLTVHWDDIESIVFYRDEALFPDLTGPYLETMWLVKKQDSKVINIMDEWSNRGALRAAFRDCLPGFDVGEARRGLRSRKAGRWTCFQRQPATSAPPAPSSVLASS